MQLLTALTDAGRDVDLRVFPPGHHGAVYNQASLNVMLQAELEFLARYLKSGSAATPAIP
jgi:dipeptidyl-peptidase-4